MQFKQTLLALAIGVTAMSAHAATGILNAGDILTITPGTATTSSGGTVSPTGGSYFKMLGAGGAVINPGSDGGIVIGKITSGGQIDNWTFSGAAGQDITTNGVTAISATQLNFSGWNVLYNGATIPMTTGAWNTPTIAADYVAGPYTNGVANFSWDGIYGHTYKLTYHATVPSNVQGFANIKYDLNLTGVVNQGAVAPVPEASTYGMMIVGLGLVGAAVMRRRKV